MEKENHFTQTQLPAHIAAFAAATMATMATSHCSHSLFFSLVLTLSLIALQNYASFIGINDNSSCSFVNNGSHLIFIYFVTFGCFINNPLW